MSVTVLGPGVTTVEKADSSLCGAHRPASAADMGTTACQRAPRNPRGGGRGGGTSLLQKSRGIFPKVNKLPPDFTYL